MRLFVVLLIVIAAILAILFVIPKFSKKENAPPVAQSRNDELRTPEEELAGFKLAEGFVIELVASERDGIINPIDLTFDDAGRLWTQTAAMYPLDPIPDAQWSDIERLRDNPKEQKNYPSFKRILDLYQGKTKGVDKILILSNLYDKKTPVKTTVWADSLTIPMSILPYKNGAYVAQGSELFFLNDSNKDGRADQRIPMFTGFGFVDTHTMAHLLVRGPGDWIYFCHGALNKGEVSSFMSKVKVKVNYNKVARFSMDAKKLELVNSGLNNTWGFQLRNNGQWYGTEANDWGYSVVPEEPGTGFPGIGNDRLHEYQPFMPELHKFRVGGTGISGLAFVDDISGSFPPEWKDVALLANPITNKINAVKIRRNPDGTLEASLLSDLLTSEDKYFRPVNIEFGPDGCLYVADWYDKIISHNEVSRSDPNRDKTHGRIWRIRHVSQKPFTIPDFNKVGTEALVDYLKSPSEWMKRAAWHQVSDRPLEETSKLAPVLVALTADQTQDDITRIHALWSLEGIKHFDAKLMSELLAAPGPDLRREAIRSLASFQLDPSQAADALKGLIEDPNPMIRSQVLRTLADLGRADGSTIDILVRASKPELPGNQLGGPYERKFERYLALKALEQYAGELNAYMKSAAASQVPAINRLWASQALPKNTREKTFLSLWPSAGLHQLDESTFMMVSKMLANDGIYAVVKRVIDDSVNAARHVEIALNNQQQMQSARLSSLLETPVRQLLRSNNDANRQLALDAIGRMNIKTKKEDIVSLIDDKTSSKTLMLVLKVLELNPGEHKQYFLQILQNKNYQFDARIAALHSLSKADPRTALQNVEHWIPEFSPEQKKVLVSRLSGSAEGAGILINLFDKSLIDINAFDLSAAENVYNSALKNEVANRIITQARKQAAGERQAFEGKLEKYNAIADRNAGDVDKGRLIFETRCLQCHKVGQKGQGIAPALDGSSNRGNQGLLTAILDPDDAVEEGYSLYRVTKRDNSIIEGYLFNKSDRGTTISFMGGSNTFIESSSIKEEGFVEGRSFMPKGLMDGFSDEDVANLFAYFHTLK